MVSLYSHQLDAVEKLKTGRILKGGVGTGKSRTAIAWYFFKVCQGQLPVNGCGEAHPMKYPKDLYIITTAQKRDKAEWQEDIAPFSMSVGTGEHRDNKDGNVIIVDSWNNVTKYTDVAHAVFIFDEQRLVGSGVWVKSFYKIAKQNDWILLTATPGDTWMDYVPVFVANGFYKNKTAFVRRHAVYDRFSRFPKIDRFVDENILNGLRHRITVDMPYQKKTIPHNHVLIADYDKRIYDLVYKQRWNPYTDEPIKNISELCQTLRKTINSDPTRMDLVNGIMQDHDKVIVFYNFDYELEILRTINKRRGWVVREWNGHKHEEIPHDADKWVYLVQYTSGSEGWNCIETNCEIYYSLNYSYRTMEQASGRIDRLNTPYTDLHYYQIRSNAKIDLEIAKAVEKKRIFNERDFV